MKSDGPNTTATSHFLSSMHHFPQGFAGAVEGEDDALLKIFPIYNGEINACLSDIENQNHYGAQQSSSNSNIVQPKPLGDWEIDSIVSESSRGNGKFVRRLSSAAPSFHEKATSTSETDYLTEQQQQRNQIEYMKLHQTTPNYNRNYLEQKGLNLLHNHYASVNEILLDDPTEFPAVETMEKAIFHGDTSSIKHHHISKDCVPLSIKNAEQKTLTKSSSHAVAENELEYYERFQNENRFSQYNDYCNLHKRKKLNQNNSNTSSSLSSAISGSSIGLLDAPQQSLGHCVGNNIQTLLSPSNRLSSECQSQDINDIHFNNDHLTSPSIHSSRHDKSFLLSSLHRMPSNNNDNSLNERISVNYTKLSQQQAILNEKLFPSTAHQIKDYQKEKKCFNEGNDNHTAQHIQDDFNHHKYYHNDQKNNMSLKKKKNENLKEILVKKKNDENQEDNNENINNNNNEKHCEPSSSSTVVLTDHINDNNNIIIKKNYYLNSLQHRDLKENNNIYLMQSLDNNQPLYELGRDEYEININNTFETKKHNYLNKNNNNNNEQQQRISNNAFNNHDDDDNNNQRYSYNHDAPLLQLEKRFMTNKPTIEAKSLKHKTLITRSSTPTTSFFIPYSLEENEDHKICYKSNNNSRYSFPAKKTKSDHITTTRYKHLSSSLSSSPVLDSNNNNNNNDDLVYKHIQSSPILTMPQDENHLKHLENQIIPSIRCVVSRNNSNVVVSNNLIYNNKNDDFITTTTTTPGGSTIAATTVGATTPLDFETLLEQTLKDDPNAIIIQPNLKNQNSLQNIKPKKPFLKKGARNPITSVPQTIRKYRYYADIAKATAPTTPKTTTVTKTHKMLNNNNQTKLSNIKNSSLNEKKTALILKPTPLKHNYSQKNGMNCSQKLEIEEEKSNQNKHEASKTPPLSLFKKTNTQPYHTRKSIHLTSPLSQTQTNLKQQHNRFIENSKESSSSSPLLNKKVLYNNPKNKYQTTPAATLKSDHVNSSLLHQYGKNDSNDNNDDDDDIHHHQQTSTQIIEKHQDKGYDIVMPPKQQIMKCNKTLFHTTKQLSSPFSSENFCKSTATTTINLNNAKFTTNNSPSHHLDSKSFYNKKASKSILPNTIDDDDDDRRQLENLNNENRNFSHCVELEKNNTLPDASIVSINENTSKKEALPSSEHLHHDSTSISPSNLLVKQKRHTRCHVYPTSTTPPPITSLNLQDPTSVMLGGPSGSYGDVKRKELRHYYGIVVPPSQQQQEQNSQQFSAKGKGKSHFLGPRNIITVDEEEEQKKTLDPLLSPTLCQKNYRQTMPIGSKSLQHKEEPQFSEKNKSFHSFQLDNLLLQAQSKIAAVEEQLISLKQIQEQVEVKSQQLDEDRLVWEKQKEQDLLNLEDEKQRLRIQSKKAKTEIKTEFEEQRKKLENATLERKSLETTIVQLQNKIQHNQEEYSIKDERYRRLVHQMKNQISILKNENKILNDKFINLQHVSQKLNERLCGQKYLLNNKHQASLSSQSSFETLQPYCFPKDISEYHIASTAADLPQRSNNGSFRRSKTSISSSSSSSKDFKNELKSEHSQSIQHGSKSTLQHSYSSPCLTYNQQSLFLQNNNDDKEKQNIVHRRVISPKKYNEYLEERQKETSSTTTGNCNIIKQKHSNKEDSIVPSSTVSNNNSSKNHSNNSCTSDHKRSYKGGLKNDGSLLITETHSLPKPSLTTTKMTSLNNNHNHHHFSNTASIVLDNQHKRITSALSRTSEFGIGAHVPEEEDINEMKQRERTLSSTAAIYSNFEKNQLKKRLEKNKLPQSEFNDLLCFILGKHWEPFEKMLEQLNKDSSDLKNNTIISTSFRSDGKQEICYNDGKREFIFKNGIRKIECPTGWTVSYFTNGDLRGTSSDGHVYYYYNADTIYTITTPDKRVYNRFSDGQLDCRFPDGKVQVRFPQGLLKQIDPNGVEHIQCIEPLTPPILQSYGNGIFSTTTANKDRRNIPVFAC